MLTMLLKRARLVSAQGGDAAFDLLKTGQADALAGLTLAQLSQLPSRIADFWRLASRKGA